VSDLHGLTDAELTTVRLLVTGQHAKQGGLAGAIGTYHANDAAARQLKTQVIDQQTIAKALAQRASFDDGIAQPRPGRDADLAGIARALVGALHQLVIGPEPGLALRLA